MVALLNNRHTRPQGMITLLNFRRTQPQGMITLLNDTGSLACVSRIASQDN